MLPALVVSLARIAVCTRDALVCGLTVMVAVVVEAALRESNTSAMQIRRCRTDEEPAGRVVAAVEDSERLCTAMRAPLLGEVKPNW